MSDIPNTSGQQPAFPGAGGSLGFQIEILKCQMLMREEQAKHNAAIREQTAKAHEEWRAAVAKADAEREEDRQRREQMIAAELARADKIIELLTALTASANTQDHARHS
jgi:hypothetical protein